MITGTRHTGLVVRDIERSLSFYRNILGLTLWKREKEEGPFIENVVAIKDVVIEWAKLKTPDGSVVELLQYPAHPEAKDRAENAPSNRQGCSHIAFTVEDIDAVYKKLQSNECHCNSGPQTSPDGLARVMYCHDPDGIIIEFVEEIKAE